MPKKNRNKKTIDIEPEVEAAIRALAAELRVPESQLYNYFVARGLMDIDWADLQRRLVESRGIRYKHNISLDDLLNGLE